MVFTTVAALKIGFTSHPELQERVQRMGSPNGIQSLYVRRLAKKHFGKDYAGILVKAVKRADLVSRHGDAGAFLSGILKTIDAPALYAFLTEAIGAKYFPLSCDEMDV